jgi:Na+/H+-dicarboxylate symporter
VYYVLAYSAAVALFALLVYPIAALAGRIPLPRFTRAALPAQTVALSSSSSLASLPALIEGAQSLGMPPPITGFVLPLSVSVFKATTPIVWLIGTLFLAKLDGIALGTGAIVTIALTSVLLSLTIPGVPRRGYDSRSLRDGGERDERSRGRDDRRRPPVRAGGGGA